MIKTETIQIKVSSKVKRKVDDIFSTVGLTTSEAIEIFLNAAVDKNGWPCVLALPEDREDVNLAIGIASLGGHKPSKLAKELLILCKRGVIDYETTKYAITRAHSKH